MAEKRNITKEDIFLEARLRAEGVRIEVKKEPESGSIYRSIVLDGCDVVVGTWRNQDSYLVAAIDGEDVAILDRGEVLATGTLEPHAPWRDALMDDGTPVGKAIVATATTSSILWGYRCSISDSGRGCKYCGIYARPSSDPTIAPSAARKITARCVEATATAMKNGWRGSIIFTGGTPPQARRNQMTGNIERAMDQFRELVDEDLLSQMHIAPEAFPPKDLSEMHKWKALGLNGTAYDRQVMDPAYFKAVCPGRGEQSRWKEAQEAAAEIFGRGRGSSTGIVMGVEPMAGMLEGIEERVSSGVWPQMYTFMPAPGSPMAGMRPPSAQWFVEASEKIVDIYLRYADTFEVDLTEDTRFGYTRRGTSFYISVVDDEMARRLQEMGKIGPGLPKQDGEDPAPSAF